MPNNITPLSASLFAGLLLTGCGGGGGGDGDTGSPESSNDAPAIEEVSPEVTSSLPRHLAQINAPEAPLFKGAGVGVAIYDSGINDSHVAFSGLDISQFSKGIFGYFDYEYDEEGNSSTVYLIGDLHESEDSFRIDYRDGEPESPHGTHVATQIAGVANGVATDITLFNYDVHAFVRQDAELNTESVNPIEESADFFVGLLHAGQRTESLGINFTNHSHSGVWDMRVSGGVNYRPQYLEIADVSVGLVVAAGNDGINISDIYSNVDSVPKCTDEEYEASTGYERNRCNALKFDRDNKRPVPLDEDLKEIMVLVGAVTPANTRAAFSNHPGNDCRIQERFLVAPGTELFGADQVDNESYDFTQGTSFAAPLVAGAAAAVKSKFRSLSNRGVLRLLLSTANRSFDGYNAIEHGQGLLDVQAALNSDPSNYLDTSPENLRAMCS